MPIQFDKFDPNKVERLRTHLVSMAAKGQAKFFEIFVDALKAVPKTDDPAEFEGYVDYMSPDTAQLKIVIYNSGNSPRNDQYVFMHKAKDREDAMEIGLNGMPIKTFSYNEIGEWREKTAKKTFEQQEILRLKREVNELKGIVDYKEEQIGQLSEVIRQNQFQGDKKSVDLGKMFGSALGMFIKSNPQALKKIPFGNELAGFLLEDGSEQTAPVIEQAPTEVNYKKKEAPENPPSVSQEDSDLLKFFKILKAHFSPVEFDQVISILESLSKDKTQLEIVVDLLGASEE